MSLFTARSVHELKPKANSRLVIPNQQLEAASSTRRSSQNSGSTLIVSVIRKQSIPHRQIYVFAQEPQNVFTQLHPRNAFISRSLSASAWIPRATSRTHQNRSRPLKLFSPTSPAARGIIARRPEIIPRFMFAITQCREFVLVGGKMLDLERWAGVCQQNVTVD